MLGDKNGKGRWTFGDEYRNVRAKGVKRRVMREMNLHARRTAWNMWNVECVNCNVADIRGVRKRRQAL